MFSAFLTYLILPEAPWVGGCYYNPMLTGEEAESSYVPPSPTSILHPSPCARGLWVPPRVHGPAGGRAAVPGAEGRAGVQQGAFAQGESGLSALFPSRVAAPPARVAWPRPSCRPWNLSPPRGGGQSIRTGRTRLSERSALRRSRSRSRRELLQAAGPGRARPGGPRPPVPATRLVCESLCLPLCVSSLGQSYLQIRVA